MLFSSKCVYFTFACIMLVKGYAVAQFALQAARSRVLDGVTGNFHWLKPYQNWVLGISPGGKGGRYVVLTILPNSSIDCLQILEASNFRSLSRPLGR